MKKKLEEEILVKVQNRLAQRMIRAMVNNKWLGLFTLFSFSIHLGVFERKTHFPRGAFKNTRKILALLDYGKNACLSVNLEAQNSPLFIVVVNRYRCFSHFMTLQTTLSFLT